VRYSGGLVESFGLTNLADSLYAIKTLVYEQKRFTLKQLVGMTDGNFEGYEAERRILLSAPKFGNDHGGVDSLHYELIRFVNEDINRQGREAGLGYFLICNLNPGAITYADITKASADGRKYGEAMAVGNAPTAGRDTEGITALLNSMARHDKRHSGFVHNLKLSKELFKPENIEKTRALFRTYFDMGGIQLMVTALNTNDLKNAMERPQDYPNLLVRMGGWTARFVELEKAYQIEFINRTMYV